MVINVVFVEIVSIICTVVAVHLFSLMMISYLPVSFIQNLSGGSSALRKSSPIKAVARFYQAENGCGFKSVPVPESTERIFSEKSVSH